MNTMQVPHFRVLEQIEHPNTSCSLLSKGCVDLVVKNKDLGPGETPLTRCRKEIENLISIIFFMNNRMRDQQRQQNKDYIDLQVTVMQQRNTIEGYSLTIDDKNALIHRMQRTALTQTSVINRQNATIEELTAENRRLCAALCAREIPIINVYSRMVSSRSEGISPVLTTPHSPSPASNAPSGL